MRKDADASTMMRVRVDPVGVRAVYRMGDPLDFSCDELLVAAVHADPAWGKGDACAAFYGNRRTMLYIVAMLVAKLSWAERLSVLGTLVRRRVRVVQADAQHDDEAQKASREVPPDA